MQEAGWCDSAAGQRCQNATPAFIHTNKTHMSSCEWLRSNFVCQRGTPTHTFRILSFLGTLSVSSHIWGHARAHIHKHTHMHNLIYQTTHCAKTNLDTSFNKSSRRFNQLPSERGGQDVDDCWNQAQEETMSSSQFRQRLCDDGFQQQLYKCLMAWVCVSECVTKAFFKKCLHARKNFDVVFYIYKCFDLFFLWVYRIFCKASLFLLTALLYYILNGNNDSLIFLNLIWKERSPPHFL